jgi:hypothetical protein
VHTVEAGATTSQTKGMRLSAEQSATWRRRVRPKPRGRVISTATATIDFVCVCRPATPASSPPT